MIDQELKDLVAQFVATSAQIIEANRAEHSAMMKERAERDAVLAKERAERDAVLAKERAERDAVLAKERAERDAVLAKEQIKAAKERAERDAVFAKERAERDAVLAKERAERDAVLAKEQIKAAKEQIKAAKERAERDAKTELDFKKMRKEIGDFGNRWGTFTEGLVIPSLHRILEKEFGIDETSEHKKKSIGNDHLELDMFGCVNSTINNAVIVEIKSHLRDDGIEQILEQLEKFPHFYPEHANKKLFGVIACVSAADNLRNVLRKKGIYLVLMGQEVAHLQRPKNFQPTNFNKR